MPKLFLSYRREESAGFAGRLAEALEAAFGQGSVFRDVDDLLPGRDFAHAIHQQLALVDAVLVLIGPRWVEIARERAARTDEVDYVMREVGAALASGKPVVPLLVGGATMPSAAELPQSIVALARRHAMELRDGAWSDDVGRLVGAMSKSLGAAPAPNSRRRKLMFAGACGATAAALVTWIAWPAARADVAGVWQASVRYPWGLERREQFDLRVDGHEIRGSADFLGVARTIVAGTVDANRVHFESHSAEVGDGGERTLTHRYAGVVDGEAIRFRMETLGGSGGHRATEFVAQRVPEAQAK